MGITEIENDINVICIKSDIFPDGIMDAYKKLFAAVPDSKGRRIFGLSREEDGGIVYFAGVEKSPSDPPEKPGMKEITIRKGKYVSKLINDYMSDLSVFGTAFQELLKNPGIDPDGYCVESYISEKDVKCMVRLQD